MFELNWLPVALEQYQEMKDKATAALETRLSSISFKKKSSVEGLFNQVHKALELLQQNPRHPGLQTHEFDSKENPFDRNGKVFEAYAQNKTPGAYRVFWCYGPDRGQITIIAITRHP